MREILYILSIIISLWFILDTRRMFKITSSSSSSLYVHNDELIISHMMKIVSLIILIIPVINISLYACEWFDRKKIYSTYKSA